MVYEKSLELIKKFPKTELIFSIPNFMAAGHYRVYPNTFFIKEYYKDVLDIHDIRTFAGSGNNKILVVRGMVK